MLSDLQSQLEFVRAVQNVNTEGVQPLVSIRDETEEGERELEIGVESLREEFEKEVVVGKRGRVVRREGSGVVRRVVEGWDPLGQAPRKRGRFFVVKRGRD